ncbi:hypothetical protein GCM10025869_34130 [Homoserinibacter gongjuensis]|uniref:Uncharacterized protein n=1 Tax=Homoserinibacter gongjuensis TaxID=1162968 RepID=A0ABQ6K0J9_9MICO|nr:hypothetical protein GCM10025869_34130 [Homoserinibacter gongjuensis]
MVGAAVDREHVIGKLGRDRTRGAVGQGEEHDIGIGEHACLGGLQFELGVTHKMRVDGAEALTGVAVSGDDAHVELGMIREQPQQLASRVSARARDGDGDGHGFNLIDSRDGAEAATSRERLRAVSAATSPRFGARGGRDGAWCSRRRSADPWARD